MANQATRFQRMGGLLRLLLFGLGLGLGLIAQPARADYTGPNRQHQVYVFTRVVSSYDGRYYCTFKHLCGDQTSETRCSKALCKDLGAGKPYLTTVAIYQNVNLPPATVTGEVQCTGQNGWCQDSAVVHITGQEPLSGYTITGIEGTRDGVQFACPGAVCDVPVSGNGTHAVTYWALSSYGDTSEQGMQQVKVDADAPQMTYSVAPGTPDGANGWYVTQPTVTVQGSDATSGIAALQVSADGGNTWHASPWAVPDGQYHLLVRAMDVAGHVTQDQVSLKVDTVPPQVLYQIPAADGQDGWHITPVQVTVSGQDATSGVADAAVAVNGGAWQSGGTPLAQDGVYTLTFRATDAAGHTTQAGPVTVKVDLHPPQVTWGAEWAQAQGCTPTLSGQITDGNGSGVAGARLSWDGGQTWQALTLDGDGRWQVQPDLRGWADGAHQVVVEAWDRAGNRTRAERTLTVANPAPHIAVAPLGRARWSFWETLHFEVATTCLPIARMRIVVEGPGRNRTETWETGGWPGPAADGSRPQKYGVDWRWDTRWDAGPYAGPGEYPVRFEAWDTWGRKWTEGGTLVVPVQAPAATPTAGPGATTPTATPTGVKAATPTPTATFVLPTAGPTATVGPTATALPRWATATALAPGGGVGQGGSGGPGAGLGPSGGGRGPTPVRHWPLWGGAAAAFVAAWMAYARRERLRRAIAEARAQARFMARLLAVQRAVWGHRAGTPPSAGEEEVVRPGEERAEEQFEDNAPPTNIPERVEIPAEARAEARFAEQMGEGGGGGASGFGTLPPQPTQADLDFDAEVGGLTPEEWHQAQQRAVALRIAHLQQAGRWFGHRPRRRWTPSRGRRPCNPRCPTPRRNRSSKPAWQARLRATCNRLKP